jgi:hypothetical protein
METWIMVFSSWFRFPKFVSANNRNSLTSKLEAAINSFNLGNTTAGGTQLQAFQNEVQAQRGHMIDAALADVLIAAAHRIINAIGP